MKFTNMRKKDVTQFYLLPTIIFSHSYLGTRVFLVWLFWSVEL